MFQTVAFTITDDSDVALIDVERDTAWVTLLEILPRTVSGLTETDELTWTPGYEELSPIDFTMLTLFENTLTK